MKKALSLILALVLAVSAMLTFGACGKDAADMTDAEYIADKGELVIGITYFEPMNYIGADGELTGFETEFATAVCEKIGVKPVFQKIEWKTKEIELNGKTIDCIWNGMTITDDRLATMSISVPYMANKQVLVVKAGNENLTSVDGLSIVAESESAGQEVIETDAFFANAEFTAVTDQATALLEVKNGTADACVVDYVLSIGMIGAGTSYEDLVVVDSQAFADEEYGVAFRQGSDMTEKVNQAMAELKADGTLDTIAAKYKLQEQIIVK